MAKRMLLAALMLVPVAAHAGLNKCKTADGKIEYSDRPCPTGAQTSQVQSSEGTVNDVNALPITGAYQDRGRKMYKEFLARPSPRAFIICRDGTLLAYHGEEVAIRDKLSKLPAGCSPYAVDNKVVWKGY